MTGECNWLVLSCLLGLATDGLGLFHGGEFLEPVSFSFALWIQKLIFNAVTFGGIQVLIRGIPLPGFFGVTNSPCKHIVAISAQ